MYKHLLNQFATIAYPLLAILMNLHRFLQYIPPNMWQCPWDLIIDREKSVNCFLPLLYNQN